MASKPDPIQMILNDMSNVVNAMQCFHQFAEAMEINAELTQKYEEASTAVQKLKDKYAQHLAVNGYATFEI